MGIFKIALINALINIDGPSMNYKICFGVFNGIATMSDFFITLINYNLGINGTKTLKIFEIKIFLILRFSQFFKIPSKKWQTTLSTPRR